MSISNRPFSIAGVTQTPESAFLRRAPRRPFDTVPGRTAREWFAFLLPQLHAGTPSEIHPHRHLKNGRGKPLLVSVVTGPSTFRNVIDGGEHV